MACATFSPSCSGSELLIDQCSKIVSLIGTFEVRFGCTARDRISGIVALQRSKEGDQLINGIFQLCPVDAHVPDLNCYVV
jgi:hypothetical protein